MITKISELEKYISAARGKPYYDYLVALGNTEDIRNKEAYRLYLWNIQISSAFLEVIALYEIALRNAIISALEANYKAYSILNDNFIRALKPLARDELLRAVNTVVKERTLTNKPFNYNEYEIIIGNDNRVLPLRIDTNVVPPGKVVAELRFVFWENMLAKTHRARWINRYNRGFTNIPSTQRDSIITDIHLITEDIRLLRNRICHHEPIFDGRKINLAHQYSQLKKVLDYISPELLEVVDDFSRINELLSNKP
ncbi:Abi family protein [Aggregatibacter actinomycetemcomitans]|uniref:Abi family protein n=1 Tax=Aggregatibacter actinomycetemcomitans TaxID=714 RepID=UPI00197BA950|nr:Abi family protein [Aggregatibacter actinomycetemcomitans]MBN6073949.1 Abi family protein [Aggregatibacter actinomycetemcomitans]